ncbi:transposable element Tcb1 transposase [Trichonephila clavata]|uniref:Transposable element Tcb1 transposase n=1 Tax=Trichonephila clavata TaxID=2740835 RepID=A0A8X6FPC7_TRICU|nr:transposable element Tcb1 transposase [Trichonephila clavata]
MQKGVGDPSFPASVLFTDDASFSHEGLFNVYSLHVWAYNNPHSTRSHTGQHCFAVNVWAGIIDDCLLEPYLLSLLLDSQKYQFFLETVLPTLLGCVLAHIRQDMLFQSDGALAHSTIVVHVCDYIISSIVSHLVH